MNPFAEVIRKPIRGRAPGVDGVGVMTFLATLRELHWGAGPLIKRRIAGCVLITAETMKKQCRDSGKESRADR